MTAELKLVGIGQVGRRDPPAVQVGAVGAVEVDDLPSAVSIADLSVMAGNPDALSIREHEVVVGVAAHPDHLFGTFVGRSERVAS